MAVAERLMAALASAFVGSSFAAARQLILLVALNHQMITNRHLGKTAMSKHLTAEQDIVLLSNFVLLIPSLRLHLLGVPTKSNRPPVSRQFALAQTEVPGEQTASSDDRRANETSRFDDATLRSHSRPEQTGVINDLSIPEFRIFAFDIDMRDIAALRDKSQSDASSERASPSQHFHHMALPIVKSLEDCGDFSQTVQPLFPQLYALPGQIVDNINSLDALGQLYVRTNPLVSGFAASLVLGFVFLVVSEVNRNYSQVDRMWSVLPNLYIVHIAAWARLAGLPHARLDLVATFSILWSCRLTFNYWRRGGYQKGSEDYRWEILQGYVPGVVWFVFNVTFIAFYQSVLLFLFSAAPTYAILLSTHFTPEVQTSDLAYLAVELALVVSEWFSDGQQWNYQTTKHQYYKDAKVPTGYKQADLDRGFNTHGLWAYCRHPNFFAEQLIWFVLYQWSNYATNNLYSWTGAGATMLIMLFQGSTWLTERITSGKYSEYKEYQKQVGMFFPKSLTPYETPARVPKVIRTSDLSKRQQKEQKQK